MYLSRLQQYIYTVRGDTHNRWHKKYRACADGTATWMLYSGRGLSSPSQSRLSLALKPKKSGKIEYDQLLSRSATALHFSSMNALELLSTRCGWVAP